MIDAGTLPVVRRGVKSPTTYVFVNVDGQRTMYYTRKEVLRAINKAADGSYIYLSKLGLRQPGVWLKRGGKLHHESDAMHASDPHSAAYVPNARRRRHLKPRRQAKRTSRGRTRNNPNTITVKLVRIGGFVDQIKYQDISDRRYYKHDGEDANTVMWLAEHHSFGRCLVIANSDAKPLWEDA